MPFPVITPTVRTLAAQHLARHDPLLAETIRRAGLCAIEPHTDYYRALVDSVIGQQLSVKAAATIKQRFRDLFGSTFPEPQAILSASIDQLCSAGLSNAKARYVQDLAQHIVDGTLVFDHIDTMSNDEIITMLTDVKGVGEWTAHMFLMFCIGRTDVLAVGDLGVRSAIRNLYGMDRLPTPQEVTALSEANHWHPYESIVCWYLWYSLDNKPM